MPDARWAQPADKADVERLFLDYLALHDEPRDRIGFATSWRESLKPRSKFRFAVVGGAKVRVAAFATIHDTYSTPAGGPTIRVEDLFVDPEHAGHGYRQRLVDFAEDYARRTKAKHVDVFVPSATRQPDFLPRGFHPWPRPPLRKPVEAKRRPGHASKADITTPPRRDRPGKNPTSVPTGRELTELFR